jgi:hypothetical protein
MVVTAAGWRAHAALVASGGHATVVAALSASAYAEAAGELIWIGPSGSPLHPRSVAVSGAVPAVTKDRVRLTLARIAPWQPAPLAPTAPAVVAETARALHRMLAALGEPRGLGRLMLARTARDEDFVAAAGPRAHALAAACAASDAAAIAGAARPLLGLGPGLTPSGDDFVGGALFARRVLAGAHGPAWAAAVARIVGDAADLTHPISARLLGDLAAGEGWAALHEFASALAAGDLRAALAGARRVVTLGHSSGWDLLAGLLTGALGDEALSIACLSGTTSKVR